MRILATLIISTLVCFSLSAQCEAGGSGTTGTTAGAGDLVSGAGGFSGSYAGSTLNQSFLNGVFNGNYAEKNRLAYEKINGSPYLNAEPTGGTLVFNDNTVMNDVPLQVDLFAGEFIATNVDGDEVILDERFFKEIVIPFEGENIVYRKSNPKKPNEFYEVLYQDGDMVFFKDRHVTLREGTDSGIAKTESKFTTRNKYFINQEDGGLVKVRLKKKDMFAGFIDSEIYAMKEYARRNGIKFKDESDYVAVFKGVNE